MLQQKRKHPAEKSCLHPRNKHRKRYNLVELTKSCPELAQFVKLNPYQDESIDFFDPDAVKMLNKALLIHFYGIEYWDIPPGYLCPPIPGRADYLHYMADLLASGNSGIIPSGNGIRCLDIGTGANCIYPVLGYKLYGWNFVGSEIDPVAIVNAKKITELNYQLSNVIEIRRQTNTNDIFKNIILPGERFDLTICNPPFHTSKTDALAGSQRKVSHLKRKKISKPVLNFGGQNNELWCPGGEEQFVCQMIIQSRQFSSSCNWFSALISKSEHLPAILYELKLVEATDIKTIHMSQGNKISRIIAWTFLPL